MAVTGLKFFGCTVKNVQTSLGFGTNKSVVRIDLVEDSKLGDVFNPVNVGFPASILYGSMSFTGLVQTYVRTDSDSGYHTYQVIIEDPRDILEGAKVILSDYLGTTANVPNLYNVYGYYEQSGFGNSEVNDAGMPWVKIRDALQTLTNTASDYGNPLIYRGQIYNLDLSNIPVPSLDYRFGGNDTNILQMIADVCLDVGCDFFVQFVYGTNIIRPQIINRRLPYAEQLLANYVNSKILSGDCVNSSIGKEIRNDNCSTFILGGQQTYNYQVAESLYYFGQDTNNNPIVGARTNPNDPWSLTARLNALEVRDIINNTFYDCNVTEMACAAHSKASWLTYVANNRPTLSFVIGAENLIGPGLAPFNVQQANLNAAWFNLRGDNAIKMADGIAAQTYVWKAERMYQFVLRHHDQYLGKKFLVPIRHVRRKVESDSLTISYSDNVVSAAYSTKTPLGMNQAFASLFGPDNNLYEAFVKYDPSCKFQVENPTNTWTLDPETGNPTFQDSLFFGTLVQNFQFPLNPPVISDASSFSLSITDATNGVNVGTLINIANRSPIFRWGAAEPDATIYLISFKIEKVNGNYTLVVDVANDNTRDGGPPILPPSGHPGLTFTLREAATITNMVGIFDLSKVPIENYIMDDSSYGVYVKANIEDKYYYYGGVPYVLADIPSPPHLTALSGWGPDINVALRPFNLDATFNNAIERVNQNWAAGTISNKLRYIPVAPVSFSIPLQSNLYCYGPWFASGAYGKVTYQKDNSLTPWSCGGIDNMNAIAAAKVNSSISYQQESESGYFTLVGEPIFNMGDLVAGGPTITNLEIGASERGVTTTYRCNTFTNRFGIQSKSSVDRIIGLSRRGEDLRKEIRRISNDVIQKSIGVRNTGVQFVQQQLVNSLAPGERPHTAGVVATFYVDNSNVSGEKFVQGGIVPIDEAIRSWRANDNDLFKTTASVSLEAVLRPISTKLAASDSDTDDFPCYTAPNPAYTRSLTVRDLDPFLNGNDINILVKGDDVSAMDGNNLLNGSTGENTQRVVALRGPVVISGWGYSVDDAYVPNANPTDLSGSMLPGYLRKSQKWATGPLEVLWDDERGVWTGIAHCLGMTNGVVSKNGGSSTIRLYQANGELLSGRKKSRTVKNFFNRDIPANTKVISVWIPEAAAWYIVAADCP